MAPKNAASDLDARLDAVGHAIRRAVLFTLREANRTGDGRVSLDELCVGLDGDSTDLEIALQHKHLPKLEERGFVTVFPAERRIEPGPRFAELIPLLDHLESSIATGTPE